MTEKSNQTVKTVSFMMMITLFGKILGLVREQFLAANYATGAEAAAFLVASRIPRTFFDVIFASAVSASFIPIFVETMQKQGKEEAYTLANRFITLISAVTIAIMAVCMVFAEPLAYLFAPGFDGTTAELCVNLLQMMFPTMLFTAVAFSFVGILQSLDEFNIPAALSVVSNGIVILYYLFCNDSFGVYGLAVAFLLGWAMQAIIQIPSLYKKGYCYRPDFHFKDDGLKKIGKLMLPVMVSTWIQPINFMINTRFASQLSNGSVTNGELGVSTLEYANNLYTIIVGVFVLAIANMVFPKFSRMTEDKTKFGQAVRVTLKSMIFLLIPMTVGLMALATPVIRVIYERGDFGFLATEMTASALFFFALGMVGYGVQNILSRAFYANQDGKTPFYSGLVSIAVNAVLCALLLKPMGIGGLALAAAVSSTASAAVLFIPTVKQYPDILDKTLLAQVGKMLAAAGGMLVLVAGSRMALEMFLSGFFGNVILLCICGGIGVISYMGFAKLLKIEESDVAFELIGKILHRRKEGAEGGATPVVTKKKNRRMYRMLEKLSLMLEDSFCFRVIARILHFFVIIWTDSIAYSMYKKICVSWANAFENSGILQFLRVNWDRYLHTQHGLLPRFWRRLTHMSGMAVRRKTNGFAAALQESVFLRIFNQNFLVLCLCGIVFAIPVFPTMLLAVLCLGTFGVYFVNLFLGRIRVQKTTMVSVLLGCFAACILYAGATSYAFPAALLSMVLFLVLMAVFFVAKDVIDTEEKLDFVLWVLISMGALIALYAVYQYIVGVEMDAAWVDAESFDMKTRAYATFTNPNVLGEYLILVGSLAAGMIWKMRRWLGKLYYTGCFGVICLGLVATGSRGAMLGLMFSAGLFVLLSEKRLIPLGIVFLMMMPFILPESLWARIASSVTMQDSSSLYRMAIYSAAFAMIKEFWSIGIGIGAFQQVYPVFSLEAAKAYHSHNLFLQEFIELGIVGFVVMVLLYLFFFQKLYSAMCTVPKRFKFLLGAIFGGFAGLLLQGMTDHLWFDYRIVLFFWCFIGIGMAAVRVGEKAREKEMGELEWYKK